MEAAEDCESMNRDTARRRRLRGRPRRSGRCGNGHRELSWQLSVLVLIATSAILGLVVLRIVVAPRARSVLPARAESRRDRRASAGPFRLLRRRRHDRLPDGAAGARLHGVRLDLPRRARTRGARDHRPRRPSALPDPGDDHGRRRDLRARRVPVLDAGAVSIRVRAHRDPDALPDRRLVLARLAPARDACARGERRASLGDLRRAVVRRSGRAVLLRRRRPRRRARIGAG